MNSNHVPTTHYSPNSFARSTSPYLRRQPLSSPVSGNPEQQQPTNWRFTPSTVTGVNSSSNSSPNDKVSLNDYTTTDSSSLCVNNVRASSLECFTRIPCLTLTSKKSLTVRALFEYNPATDIGLPGRGLSFQHGDILFVVNASDNEWWQARRLTVYGPAQVDGSHSNRPTSATATTASSFDASSSSSSSHRTTAATLTTRSALGIIPSQKRLERRQRTRTRRVNFFTNVTVIPQASSTNPHTSTQAYDTHARITETPPPFVNTYHHMGDEPHPDLVKDPNNLVSVHNGGAAAKSRSSSLTRAFLKRFSNRTLKKADPLLSNTTTTNPNTVNNHNASDNGSEFDPDTIRSYELVVPVTISLARPLLIYGPLKERVIDELLQDTKFATCVPHTTRSRRPGERDGVEYHFVPTKAQLEEQLQSGRFIEVGQYQDQYYATSMGAVQRTLQKGRVCVLDVNLPAIRRLYLAGLYPISVLLKPLSVMHLRALQGRLTEEQAKRSVDVASRLEAEHWHLFSAIIPYETINGAVESIKRYILLHGGPLIWVSSNAAERATTNDLGSHSSTLPRGLSRPFFDHQPSSSNNKQLAMISYPHSRNII